MVGNRVDWALVVLGLVIALAQLQFPRLHERLTPPTATPLPLATVAPQPSPSGSARPTATPIPVPVIWREFRPGERETGPPPEGGLRLCAAALERGKRSGLVVRFCNSVPETPKRRFALGYDDLVVRVTLPGNVTMAWDLLEYTPTEDGGKGFTQRALPDNQVTVAQVRLTEPTDILFVLAREFPVGLLTITVTGRYFGNDFSDTQAFAPLGSDLERTEAQRALFAPAWARAPYS